MEEDLKNDHMCIRQSTTVLATPSRDPLTQLRCLPTFVTAPLGTHGSCRTIAVTSRALFGWRAEPTGQRVSSEFLAETDGDKQVPSIVMVRALVHVVEYVFQRPDIKRQEQA